MSWEYFILGVIVYQIGKMLALSINQTVIERRQKRFIKLVNVTFPDNKTVSFIAVDSSDKRGMQKMERYLREQYKIPEGEAVVDLRKGDGFRN